MWVFLNDAFLSIVADRDNADRLLVRARFAGDIVAVFAEAEVSETADADYRYRARLPRQRVADALAQQALALTATNFKASVRERWRHDLYLQVWALMEQEQRRRSSRTRGSSDKQAE